MTHLIDKDALLAEIEKRISEYENCGIDNAAINAKIIALQSLLIYINTLEVRDVDDEPKCMIFPRPIECYSTCKECPWLTTNNKAQKGEEV